MPRLKKNIADNAEPIEFLRDEYARRRQKNPAYSLRAFARYLGISPARLSQVLSRKRPLTRGQLDKMAVAFALDPVVMASFSKRANPSQGARRASVAPPYDTFDLDMFRMVADWHHSAILCLVETTSGHGPLTISGIAKRLGITTIEARQAVERLLKIGLLRKVDKGFAVTRKNLATPSDVPSAALRHLHRQMLQLASESLESQTVDDRDVTSITMAIDKSKLPAAKSMVKAFRRQLCAFLEDGEANEVFALNVQLFQLSK